MSTKINNQLYKAYQKGGASAVYELANKLGLPYSPCKQCECDTPTIKHVTTVCGVCGTIKRNEPNRTMYFKDEGGYYVTKVEKDGTPADSNKLYEWGSLLPLTVTTKKEGRELAKKNGYQAIFE